MTQGGSRASGRLTLQRGGEEILLAPAGDRLTTRLTSTIRTGDSILVPSHGIHYVENISPHRLYLLSVMVPNEDFAELIRQGIPAELDEEDMAVLARTRSV